VLNDEVLAEEEEGEEEEAGGSRCAIFVTWRTSPWTSRQPFIQKIDYLHSIYSRPT
jgi:hypothetical protein